jgi:thiol-disulfide isomerase/thioredoxin
MKLYMLVKTVALLPFFSMMTCFGQELNVGDRVPDIELNNVFNYSNDQLRLSDFRGTLVILDFWGFNCISCLQSFPKMDSLQKKYGSKIQVIFVNRESKDSTRLFFEKRKKLLLPANPFVTADTVLHKVFPHSGKPYYVWIDSAGIVRYFPKGVSMTEARIKEFLSKDKMYAMEALKTRKYVRSFIDKEWRPSFEYYSYLSHCMNGIILEGERIPGFLQVTRSCLSIVELYKIAYGSDINKYPASLSEYELDRPGRVILEVKDQFQYVQPKGAKENWEEWINNYAYNYHLYLPESKKEKFLEFMREDLNRFFDLEAGIERRKVKCLVLVRSGQTDKLKTKGGKPADNFFQSDVKDTIIPTIRLMNNIPFKKFASRLETIAEYNFSMPFINGANYGGNIDFEIQTNVLDKITRSSLQMVLQKYGLALVEKLCPLDVLVIREKK